MNEWIYLMENPQDKKGHKTTYTCEVFDKKVVSKSNLGKILQKYSREIQEWLSVCDISSLVAVTTSIGDVSGQHSVGM